jgi:uncharacterized damage-inducible protein DinB
MTVPKRSRSPDSKSWYARRITDSYGFSTISGPRLHLASVTHLWLDSIKGQEAKVPTLMGEVSRWFCVACASKPFSAAVFPSPDAMKGRGLRPS